MEAGLCRLCFLNIRIMIKCLCFVDDKNFVAPAFTGTDKFAVCISCVFFTMYVFFFLKISRCTVEGLCCQESRQKIRCH